MWEKSEEVPWPVWTKELRPSTPVASVKLKSLDNHHDSDFEVEPLVPVHPQNDCSPIPANNLTTPHADPEPESPS